MRRTSMFALWLATACHADDAADPFEQVDPPVTASAGEPEVCDGDPISCVESTQCASAAPLCLAACGSDVEVGEAVCFGTTWTCSEGVAADSCAPCEGEEPLECAVSCEEGEIYEATCIDDAWDCGDGVILESCGATCGDDTTPCPQGCGGEEAEPWSCVPSCDVFEIYEATCVDEAWSCGTGVLAADC